jgi:hypothetical protein
LSKFFLFALFPIAILPFRYLIMVNDHRRIQKYMMGRNCEALDISWHPNNPLTSRSRGGSYDVLYVNAQNELYQTRCFIENYATLFWTESTFLYAASPERIERLRRFGRKVVDEPYSAKSEKEKVIDGLTSTFKFERIWAVKALTHLQQVDEQMQQLLKTIAMYDEELDVREAAVETMNQLAIAE